VQADLGRENHSSLVSRNYDFNIPDVFIAVTVIVMRNHKAALGKFVTISAVVRMIRAATPNGRKQNRTFSVKAEWVSGKSPIVCEKTFW